MNTTDKSLIQKIVAPFQVLKIEKIYYVWIVSFLISFSSIIVEILNGNTSSVFNQGAFFATCIAVVAPFFLDFVVDYSHTNRKEKKESFSTYKAWVFFISIAILFLLIVFYITKCKSNSLLQIITTVTVALLSFYSNLVYKMEDHMILMDIYKDTSYAIAENNEINKLNKKAKKLKNIVDSNGEEVKL